MPSYARTSTAEVKREVKYYIDDMFTDLNSTIRLYAIPGAGIEGDSNGELLGIAPLPLTELGFGYENDFENGSTSGPSSWISTVVDTLNKGLNWYKQNLFGRANLGEDIDNLLKTNGEGSLVGSIANFLDSSITSATKAIFGENVEALNNLSTKSLDSVLNYTQMFKGSTVGKVFENLEIPLISGMDYNGKTLRVKDQLAKILYYTLGDRQTIKSNGKNILENTLGFQESPNGFQWSTAISTESSISGTFKLVVGKDRMTINNLLIRSVSIKIPPILTTNDDYYLATVSFEFTYANKIYRKDLAKWLNLTNLNDRYSQKLSESSESYDIAYQQGRVNLGDDRVPDLSN